jgi:hypothetical protein
MGVGYFMFILRILYFNSELVRVLQSIIIDESYKHKTLKKKVIKNGL